MRKYTIVPLPEGPFEGLNLTARCCFGLIYDRWKLSANRTESFWDEDRQAVYCLFRQEELARTLGVSERSIRRSLDELYAAGLISWKKADYQGPCRYYLDWDALVYFGHIKPIKPITA